jgi:hypothetical protein
MTIKEAVSNFKDLINKAIQEGGNKGKTATIRSSLPILNIHEAVKYELIKRGVDKNLFFPPINKRSPELKLAGFLKQKDQDVCVVPNNIEQKPEILQDGLLKGLEDKYGQNFTEKTLVINIRSQISSIQKNFDTLFERTYAEAQNLHERCPNMVLGEVYLLAIPEYDDKAFGSHEVKHKPLNQNIVEKYIKSFNAITQRTVTNGSYYKYEATCLLIVDFRSDKPKIYNSTQELISDGLLPQNTVENYDNLNWNNFFIKLLKIYDTRFGVGNLT